MADDDKKKSPFEGFRVEIDPANIEDALKKVQERIREMFQAGRYTKVRLSYKGKQIGPELPLAVFLAGEGAAFLLATPLLVIFANLGAKAFLDVEFVHEADELVQEGLSLYLDGEIIEAEAKYREALKRRPDDPAALYNLGTLLRVTGRKDEALAALRKAAMGTPGHPDVVRASESVEKLQAAKRDL